MVQFGSHPGLNAPKARPALFGAGEEPSPVKQQETKKEEKLSFAQAILNSPTNKPQIDFKLAHQGVANPHSHKPASGEAAAEPTSELPSYADLVARLNKPGKTPDHWSTKFPPGLQKFFEETWKHAHHFVAAAAAVAEPETDTETDEVDKAEESAESSESSTTDSPVASIAVGEPAPAVEETPVVETKPVEEAVVSTPDPKEDPIADTSTTV